MRVEREALEEGAAANMGKWVWIPEPPVRLGSLERSQRTILGLLAVGGEDLGRPANDAPENGLHVLVLRRRQGHETVQSLIPELEKF